MRLKAQVQREKDGSYWAEVVDLPGCFASGDSFDELLEALKEAIGLCLDDRGPPSNAFETEVAEITVATAPAEPQPARA